MTSSQPPRLSLFVEPAEWVEQALAAAAVIDGLGVDVPVTLAWAAEVGRMLPRDASLTDRWQLLVGTAFLDVGAARTLEPHLDALAILGEAGIGPDGSDPDGPDPDGAATWGVFAAEGAGTRLTAEPDATGWTIHGTKPWCSLAGSLSHALVTAWVDDEHRRLFAVPLRHETVTARSGPWHARGLSQVVSAPVDFAGTPAEPVGDAGWYLRRLGFAHGGVGVAAAWWGGAMGLLPALRAAASAERADQIAHQHLGDADAALWAARAVLAETADVFSAGPRADAGLLANRARTVTVRAATLALETADLALGPLPLVADEAHARRVADLHLYLRQHHGARDAARIGRDLAASEQPW
ncbi:acyl-CoA dehydrogenase [Microbacterium sp. ET2]|uniref:acyl-CoA dehydrogenase n=1 Tax=Microbacterium albipurpureum TaxID=3050384 RepID=UPI00259CBB28|nr:acyl-CoA dehydrogenase [Microbacterium sp. ET2 (Ac-2212)]WJL94883.1 acyl-CoA dehydrogenase [Microbacterium sp. ET2 (Ac-2212)]